MAKSTFSVREVIEMALQTERLGYKFYTEMSAKFAETNPGLKELYGKLATMEKHHEEVFQKLLDKVTSQKAESELSSWDEVQNYMRAVVESQFFLGKDKALPNLSHIGSVAAATDFAINFEKETLLFFVGLRSAVKDPAPVQAIIEEEASHIAWLSKFRETLK